MHDYLIKTGYLKENEYKKYQKAAEKEFKSFKYERNAVKKAFMPKNVIDVAKKMYLNDILNQYRKQNEMIQL
jgi:hypothetical protein